MTSSTGPISYTYAKDFIEQDFHKQLGLGAKLRRLTEVFDVMESQKGIPELLIKLNAIAQEVLQFSPSFRLGHNNSIYSHDENALGMRVISYNYRVSKFPVMAPDNVQLQNLMDLAEEWLSQQPLKSYRYVDDKLTPDDALTLHQRQALATAASYPEFCKLVIKDKFLRVDFFKWALIDGCPVSPFIQFYGTCQNIIKKAFLHKRIGYYGGKPLQIENRKSGEKKLVMPFGVDDGSVRWYSIHNPDRKITFEEGLKVELCEVFRHFSRKNDEPGNFEMLDGVICNWHYFHGRWNPTEQRYTGFDLEDSNWCRKLPVFDTLTEEQMRAKFNVTEVMGSTDCLMTVMANRDYPNMDIAKTHGFLTFMIPANFMATEYFVMPFTFLATQFTTGWQHLPAVDLALKVLRLGKTERGLWAYPDETLFYTRQQAAFSVVISQDEMLTHMEELRAEFLSARAGNEYFQLPYKNCGGTVQLQLERIYPRTIVPDLFGAHILECTPQEPVGRVFRWAREAPPWQVATVIWFFGVLLLAWKGMWVRDSDGLRYAAMMRTPIFNPETRRIFHVGKMFQKLEAGTIRGAIWTGHAPKETLALTEVYGSSHAE